jgi:hypothetical protein
MKISNFLGINSKDYIIRISQENVDKPMIFSDITLYPFQNYVLTGVLDDGTINYSQVPNNLTSFLQ